MPNPDLVVAADLADFPGAPFTASQVESAGGQVRAQCGWHIAPEVTETLTVDAEGGRLLLLPTLRLVAVTAVRDVTGASPRNVEGFRFNAAGVLRLSGGRWPDEIASVEVTVTHGYTFCPPELLPVVAERCQMFGKDGGIRQESLGSRSVSYGFNEGSQSSSVLSRFRLGPRP